MASAKAGVHQLQLKPVQAPDFVLRGQRFFKFDDVDASGAGNYVVLRVDPKGFIVVWASVTDSARDFLEFSSVLDVRSGRHARLPKDSDRAREQLAGSFVIPASSFDASFVTIVSGPHFTDLTFTTFLAPSPDIAEQWADELFRISQNQLARNGNIMHFLNGFYAKIRWGCCVGDEPNTIVYGRDIVRMMAHERNRDERRAVEKALESCALPSGKDSIAAEHFTEESFYHFYRVLTARRDVDRVFAEVQATAPPPSRKTSRAPTPSATPTIGLRQLVDLLNQEQRDPRLNEILYPYYTEESTRPLIERYEPSAELRNKGLLSFDGFLRLLLGDDNAALNADALDIKRDDMDHPLAHYFISSSHNTYLTAAQIGGASVEMYRQVLLSGCRSVELDCYEHNGIDIEIKHGNLSSSVPFKEVLEAIAESAFKTSDYPVILSFENHVKAAKLQAKMAEYCREVFGEMLLTEPLPSHPLEPGVPLPSPAQLKRKIMIKNKKTEPKESRSEDALNAGAGATDARRTAPLVSSDTVESTDSKTESSSTDLVAASLPPSESTDALQDAADPTAVAKEPLEEEAVVSELAALVNYMRASSSKFKSFQESEQRNLSSEMFSMMELDAHNLVAGLFSTEFVNHNKRQITRVYPKGKRIMSDNLFPQIYWDVGCQMCALNFQTPDNAMQLNQAVFEMNGRCGYLLKPECMRLADRYFDPYESDAVENTVANTVSVQILSGQLFSTMRSADRRLSTYVEVSMVGLPADTSKGKREYKTRTVANNGINPVYNSDPFDFKVVLPELAALRVRLFDENNRPLGQRILPVLAMRPGYRHICLRTQSNQPLGLASLFTRIVVKDFVPDAYVDVVDALLDPIAATRQWDYFANALANPIEYVNELKKHEEMLRCMNEGDDDDDSGSSQEDGPSAVNHLPAAAAASPRPQPPTDNISSHSASAPTASRLPPKQPSQDSTSGGSTNAPAGPMTPRQKLSMMGGSGGSGKTLLETYPFSIPTLDSLTADKKFDKLRRRQEKELDTMRLRHGKERDQMRVKHERQLNEMAADKNGSSSFAFRRSVRAAISLKQSSDTLRLQSPRKTTDALQLEQEQLAELRRLCTRHWTEELAQLSEHQQVMRANLTALSDQMFKSAIRTLDTVYTRDVAELMKTSQDKRKVDVANVTKAASDKAELTKRKRDIEQQAISAAVEQRRQMSETRKTREADIKDAFAELSKAIESAHSLKMANLKADYESKIESGEIPVEISKL